MIFEFQILGLVIVFLLVIFYYMGCDRYRKKEMDFKYLLLATYLSQLVYICTYVAIQMRNYDTFYGKLYLILTLSIYSGLVFYYLTSWMKEKYQNQMQVLNVKIGTMKFWVMLFTLFNTMLILFSDIKIVMNKIQYQHHIFFFFVIFYFVLGFISLVLGRKDISSKKYFHLWIIYFIGIGGIILQNYFNDLAILNYSLVVMILYLYVTLENLDTKELEVLRLERDYNSKQNIDKVAFLKNISHEIRTPINTIDGFSQLILDSEDMNEIKNDVKDIRLASRDLMDVINGMIDLSVIESGNLEIISENYNVYDMFDEVIDIVNSKLRDKEVSLEVNLAKDIPEVLFGDSERISQVLLNIFKNSIKYTDKGKISLFVECVRSKTKCRLKIVIEDTGRGITDEEKKSIFVNSDDKRKGLGLLVSKYLIELMDGSLEIDSTYQEGTTITIVLDQKIISERQVKKNSNKKVLKPFNAKNKRILIVDDNQLNLKVVSKLLVPYGVEILEASSGKECLDLLEKDTHFDLILMDDLMPEMSGTETLDILKKIQRVDGYYIPVVVVTANAISGQREKYLEMGFEDYLAKPIERYELDRILKKYLMGKNNE